MTLTTIPDIEKIASDFLRSHADIVALNTRIVGKTPTADTGGTTKSWVRVTKLDDPQVNHPDHLVSFMLQFDCYAGKTGGQPEATDLAFAVRAVLGTLPGARSGGVVNGVQILGGPRIKDTDLEPARDREILTAFVWAHS